MGKRLIIPGADFSANAIEGEPIVVPVEFTLQNGYASAFNSFVEIDETAASNLIRVRTDQLYGSYTVKTKTGYTIRAIASYDDSIDITGPGKYYPSNSVSESNVSGKTEYTFNGDTRYSIITFCKTNSSEQISASDDIVDYIIRPLE